MAAVVVVPVFQRLRTSPVLGYLAAGILIGPYGLALIRDSEAAHTLAEFGVVFLLFMIGLELSIERLRSLSRYVFGLGTLQVIALLVAGLMIGKSVVTAALCRSFGLSLGVSETLEASLQLGAITLTSLGKRSDEVTSIVQELRKDDYANLSDVIRGGQS